MLNITALAFAAADKAAEHGEAYSKSMLEDTSFWVLLAFAIVVFIFARAGVHKLMVGGLDKRSQKIADEINEARKMREEAQEVLAQYQRRQREAEAEAEAIIEQAKRDAERMTEEARDKINEQVERRTKAAEERIERAEAQAVSEVRNQAVDLAAGAAEHIIRERMDSGAQTAIVDKAISGLRSKLN